MVTGTEEAEDRAFHPRAKAIVEGRGSNLVSGADRGDELVVVPPGVGRLRALLGTPRGRDQAEAGTGSDGHCSKGTLTALQADSGPFDV